MLGALRSATFVTSVRGTPRRCALLVLLAAAFSGAANAQLDVLIVKGIPRPVPVAIVPFGWGGSGPAAYDIAGVVTSDLKSSGRFAPLPVADMVSKPSQPEQVNFTDWRLVKVDYVVIGTLQETGPGQIGTPFPPFDLPKGEPKLGFPFPSS